MGMSSREDVRSSCSALARMLQKTAGRTHVSKGKKKRLFFDTARTSTRTRVIPRAAICRARTRGSLPSGDPSSNPDFQMEDDVCMYVRLHAKRHSRKKKKGGGGGGGEQANSPSAYSQTPWGGASAMSTIILLACSLQSIFSASARPAVTASGPSPPPEAYKLERSRWTLSMSDEKPKLRVT